MLLFIISSVFAKQKGQVLGSTSECQGISLEKSEYCPLTQYLAPINLVSALATLIEINDLGKLRELGYNDLSTVQDFDYVFKTMVLPNKARIQYKLGNCAFSNYGVPHFRAYACIQLLRLNSTCLPTSVSQPNGLCSNIVPDMVNSMQQNYEKDDSCGKESDKMKQATDNYLKTKSLNYMSSQSKDCITFDTNCGFDEPNFACKNMCKNTTTECDSFTLTEASFSSSSSIFAIAFGVITLLLIIGVFIYYRFFYKKPFKFDNQTESMPPQLETPKIPKMSIMRESTASDISLRRETMMQAQKMTQNTSIVIFSFEATKEDELSLEPGDMVQVEKKFEDGWGYGHKLNSSSSGVFPLSCLE